VQETCNGQIEKQKAIHQEEMYIFEEQHGQKMQEQDERHRTELENKVNQQVQLQLTEHEKKSNKFSRLQNNIIQNQTKDTRKNTSLVIG
jgi:hypothetical protein